MYLGPYCWPYEHENSVILLQDVWYFGRGCDKLVLHLLLLHLFQYLTYKDPKCVLLFFFSVWKFLNVHSGHRWMLNSKPRLLFLVVEDINKRREPISSLEAIYLISPVEKVRYSIFALKRQLTHSPIVFIYFIFPFIKHVCYSISVSTCSHQWLQIRCLCLQSSTHLLHWQ